MRRYVPRVLLTAALAVAATTAAEAQGGAAGGRPRVLVPEFPGQEGDKVADRLRDLIGDMQSHTAVSEKDMKATMGKYKLTELDEITARQLAQQMEVQLVAWGNVEQAAGGLQADVRFIDVRTGDQLELTDVTSANAKDLAQAIALQFGQKVEGLRFAAQCTEGLAAQQYEQALNTCNQALASVPTSATALYGKAASLFNLERYDEALPVYQQLLQVDPAHQDALLGAGLSASRAKQSDAASEFYRRYMEVNPGDAKTRLAVANDIVKTGDFVSAFRLLQPVAAENRQDADFTKFFLLTASAAGQTLAATDKAAAQPYLQAALEAYQALAGTPAMDAATMRQAIAVNTALGNSAQALEVARQATERFATDASIWFQYGQALEEAGRHADAVNAYTQVINIDPATENVFLRRGIAHNAAGNAQAALADLEQSAQRGNKENVARVLYAMGAQLLRDRKFGDAAGLLAIASRNAGADLKSDVSFFYGYSLYMRGEEITKANTAGELAPAQEALQLFTQALEALQASQHANAAQMATAAAKYIEYQNAVIKARSGGN